MGGTDMTYNIWQGERVRLRAMEPQDWDVFHRNDEDAETARLCYWIPFPRSAEASRKWAQDEAMEGARGDAVRLVIENGAGEVVGNLNTMECDRRCGTFKYGIAILRPHWGKGYATEAIRLLLRYYFQELRYQKCTVHVYDFNEASLKLHQKLGFQVEGRLRRMIFTNGAYHDEYALGITVEEFCRAGSGC
jgi:RimJ/RimL family protein N-acetyltransferase